MNDDQILKMYPVMSNKRNILLVVSFMLIHYTVSAQLPDGVTATQSFLNEVIKNYKDENSLLFDLNSVTTHVNIPVQVHVVMNIKGSAGVNKNSINSSFDLANGYFKQVGIHFFIDTLDYINDYNYSYITYNYLKKELLTKFAVNNRINLFLVDSIKMGSDYCYGFTYFPDEPDSNFIYLVKSYLSGNSLATMLGHFMGLLSTHETAGGRELASGKNCAESGDYICDTYADPDLFNQVIDTCKYIGTMRDDNGKYYIPSVANLMSESPDKCRCILTPLQYRRIYYYYFRYRQYLTY
jgi:hypothetical protein